MPTHVQLGMKLTGRECLALIFASRGCTDAQIAKRMLVSEATAKRRMHSARTKLGARSRTHAVALGLSLGIIPLLEVGRKNE